MVDDKNSACVQEIAGDWLEANGFDGLCNGESGCTLDSLMVCCCVSEYDCVPAKLVPASHGEDAGGCGASLPSAVPEGLGARP